MSITRKIAHNTASQMIGKAISTFLGLIAIGMMTRYLGIEQFGWYITTITFLQFVGILIDFGLIPVTAQMMSEPHFEKNKLFKNLLGYRFTTAIVFLAVAPLVALLFPYPIEAKIAISFTTVSFLAISMNQILTGFYQSKLKMHLQAISEVVGRIVLVGGLWLLIKNGSSFLPIMIVVTLSSVAYMIAMFVFASRETKISFGFDWQIWKAITIKMWPIAVSIIFNVIYLKGDILLLTFFGTQAEVGIYGAAYRVIDILAQTAMMIMGIMLPLLAYSWSRKMKDDFRHRYQMSFDIMMMLALPMIVGTMLLAPKIMTLIAGPEFIVAGGPLQILSLAVFGLFLGGIFGHVAVAINKQKQTMWIYISNAVITLGGYLIVIPIHGMYGAAWMTVFSEMYAGVLLFLVIRHYSKQKLKLITFGKILFSSAIMGLVIYFLMHLHVLILVLIGMLVYGIILFATKGISRETIKEIIS